MLLKLQANVNETHSNPLWKDLNDVIYCNVGGKENMSLTAKNIPPMMGNTIPLEVLVRDTTKEDLYTKVKCYSYSCLLSSSCAEEQPIFRFQLIYDGYDFLYYPEFKLYERPYLILERNYSVGSDTLVFSGVESLTNNNVKNVALCVAGDILKFLDTDDVYVVSEKEVVGGETILILDKPLEMNHYLNDTIIVANRKYEEKSDSNIMLDGDENCSPFKFKFTGTGIKTYAISKYSKLADDKSTLINNNTTGITDLLGDDKIVSLAFDSDIAIANIAMGGDIDTPDTEIEFSSAITGLLDVNSYFTLESDTAREIVKVTEVISSVRVRVERGQLDTEAGYFASATTDIYLPKYIKFLMIPFNKYIDQRYLVFRNIDFVLTWV